MVIPGPGFPRASRNAILSAPLDRTPEVSCEILLEHDVAFPNPLKLKRISRMLEERFLTRLSCRASGGEGSLGGVSSGFGWCHGLAVVWTISRTA